MFSIPIECVTFPESSIMKDSWKSFYSLISSYWLFYSWDYYILGIFFCMASAFFWLFNSTSFFYICSMNFSNWSFSSSSSWGWLMKLKFSNPSIWMGCNSPSTEFVKSFCWECMLDFRLLVFRIFYGRLNYPWPPSSWLMDPIRESFFVSFRFSYRLWSYEFFNVFLSRMV